MARYCKSFLFLAVMLLASCQEGGEAGDFLGQWRLSGSDTNFLSFSGSVVLFRDTKLSGNMVYGNFQHKGDSLFIQCYSAKGNAKDTTVVEDHFGFKPFNDIRLRLVTLNGDLLIVSQGSNTWQFEKY